jgi:hypothetical protein
MISGNAYGVYAAGASAPNMNCNNICGNSLYGLCNGSSPMTIGAENGWWGDTSGPYHPVTNPLGAGNAVSDYVDYEPWLAAELNPALLVHGDATGDGLVDGRDVVVCKRMVLALEGAACSADANEDGVLDGRDVIRIKKIILGIG